MKGRVSLPEPYQGALIRLLSPAEHPFAALTARDQAPETRNLFATPPVIGGARCSLVVVVLKSFQEQCLGEPTLRASIQVVWS
jgi:hypothetical protein